VSGASKAGIGDQPPSPRLRRATGVRGQAGCPRWIKFLEETVGSRRAVRAFLGLLARRLSGVASPEGGKEGTQRKGAVQCRN
jgi:hypothetical protein